MKTASELCSEYDALISADPLNLPHDTVSLADMWYSISHILNERNY